MRVGAFPLVTTRWWVTHKILVVENKKTKAKRVVGGKISISKLFCSSESLWLIFYLSLFHFFKSIFSSSFLIKYIYFPERSPACRRWRGEPTWFSYSLLIFMQSGFDFGGIFAEMENEKIAENCCITFTLILLLGGVESSDGDSPPHRRTHTTQTCHTTTITQTNEMHLSGSRSQSNVHHKPKTKQKTKLRRPSIKNASIGARRMFRTSEDLFNLHV